MYTRLLPFFILAVLALAQCEHGYWIRGHGCYCLRGWTGDACSVNVCRQLGCVHGSCGSGACECEAPWSGTRCDTVSGDLFVLDNIYSDEQVQQTQRGQLELL